MAPERSQQHTQATNQASALKNNRVFGPLRRVYGKNKKNGGVFLTLEFDGQIKVFLFDNKPLDFGKPKGTIPAFEELLRSQNNPVELLVEKNTKDGREYLNVKQVLRIGPYEWEEGTGIPVIQRREPGEEIADPPLTDSDIGF